MALLTDGDHELLLDAFVLELRMVLDVSVIPPSWIVNISD
jgi:hypothetical protein